MKLVGLDKTTRPDVLARSRTAIELSMPYSPSDPLDESESTCAGLT